MSPQELLAKGELTVRGRIRGASNAVLYCTVEYDGVSAACVYKPVAGERPLWDFPDGTLAQREVAAYELSEAMGWGLVPPTVLRDGPYGEGMCQLWIEASEAPEGAAGASGETETSEAPQGTQGLDQPEKPSAPPGASRADAPAGAEGVAHGPLLALVDGDQPGEGWKAVGFAEVGGPGEERTALLVHADDVRLRRLAVLDAVINNGDRKGGHLLPAADGRIYAIDHGVTFNADDKLRTLLWGWAGEPLTEEALDALRRLSDDLAEDRPLTARLTELITPAEIQALRARVADLLRTGRHREPSGQWPAIPWPPV
ncbi:putative repeat protein (TIGR03843 family) [Streptomyces eurocidicus]|uniref:Putative repeat protein (TIGR03843 family) n=1 Tax=Streptomyces eurocidicus TaxID=66423 RepID=A0A7W8BD41_STREU|nr:putative repeat protein (TIGR03843 family) [Streptomyces eurocidicus]